MKRLLLSGLLFSACASSSPPPPLTVDQVVSTQRLTGPEGLVFELAQSKDSALVRVSGLPGPYDGVVFDCELTGTLAARYFETKIDGRDWRVLIRDEGRWKTFVPGARGVALQEAEGEVDPKALLRTHLRQRKEGRIAEIARFDEKAARAEALAALTEDVSEPCGRSLTVEIDGSSLGQAELMKYAIADYCDSGAAALARVCETPELRAAFGPTVEAYRCTFGEASGLDIEGGVMTYTVQFGAPNLDQWAREALDAYEFAPGRTVAQARHEHESAVCRFPEQEAFAVVGSDRSRYAGVSFRPADAKVAYRQPERRFLPGGWFFDPRFRNPQNNEAFRGYDLRVFSHVSSEDGRCELTCGAETKPLIQLSAEEKRAFFAETDFQALPNPREAYALARDRRGRYYYVDRGATPDSARDFRLYVGRPGQLRLQQMEDIVSDSEGEIFESKNGKLRLLLAAEEAEWITPGRKRRLTRVPVQDNHELIYGRLGVYLGRPLHTPCDAFYR